MNQNILLLSLTLLTISPMFADTIPTDPEKWFNDSADDEIGLYTLYEKLKKNPETNTKKPQISSTEEELKNNQEKLEKCMIALTILHKEKNSYIHHTMYGSIVLIGAVAARIEDTITTIPAIAIGLAGLGYGFYNLGYIRSHTKQINEKNLKKANILLEGEGIEHRKSN